MIESLTKDPFDAVFFFEEELGRIDQYKNIYFYEKDLIAEVLKYNFGDDLNIDNLKMRGTSIWRSKKDEKNNITDPIFKVWFVGGIYLNEKIIEQNPRFIIHFPSSIGQKGDLIILEDFFKYFFGQKLYVYFDKDGKITPLQNREEILLFEIQTRCIIDFANLLKTLHDKDINYIYSSLSYINLVTKNSPGNISKGVNIDFLTLITLASIRRWLRSSITHLMSKREFDDKVIVPLVASFLHSQTYYLDTNIDWKNPILVKAVANLAIEMMNILESSKLRNLDLTRRHIEFVKSIESIDPASYCNVEELEGIIKNVREEESSGETCKKHFSTNKKYPW